MKNVMSDFAPDAALVPAPGDCVVIMSPQPATRHALANAIPILARFMFSSPGFPAGCQARRASVNIGGRDAIPARAFVKIDREDGMKDEHFASALRRDGFDVERRSLLPLCVVAEHAHPYDVRALVLNGQITLTVEGVEYAYREGDIFVLPAGHRHAEAVGPAGVDYLVGRRLLDATPTTDRQGAS
jgi:quercetin dioxygenase-like cupin family protein